MITTVVQKYGGTSVGTVERIKNVARRVVESRARCERLIVVVSAMAGETDRLLSLSTAISASPSQRETDVLLATGEQVSIALLCMAIQELGHEAVSFLGHQICIRTDRAYTRARIQEIVAPKMEAALDAGKIAVVAGFQGVDDDGNITTLGRGGSDTTAVAIAAAVNADVCEIFTDVDGIYTADPNICPGARKIDRISYEEMLELASLGAKVLQTRSVEFAMKYNVPIHVRSSFTDAEGSWVVREEESMEKVVVTGVAYDRNEAKVTIKNVPDQPGIAFRVCKPLAEQNINVDMIIQNASEEGFTDMTFTVSQADVERACAIVSEAAKELGGGPVVSDTKIAKVSVVGVGMRSHAGVASRAFEALFNAGINIMMISTSEIKVSCVIDAKFTELAVRVLHDAFELDRAPEH